MDSADAKSAPEPDTSCAAGGDTASRRADATPVETVWCTCGGTPRLPGGAHAELGSHVSAGGPAGGIHANCLGECICTARLVCVSGEAVATSAELLCASSSILRGIIKADEADGVVDVGVGNRAGGRDGCVVIDTQGDAAADWQAALQLLLPAAPAPTGKTWAEMVQQRSWDGITRVLRLAAKWDIPYVLGACVRALQDALCAPDKAPGGEQAEGEADEAPLLDEPSPRGQEALRPFALLEVATQLGAEGLRDACMHNIATRLALATSADAREQATARDYLDRLATLAAKTSAGNHSGHPPHEHTNFVLDSWAAGQLLGPLVTSLQQACVQVDRARQEAQQARCEAAVLKRMHAETPYMMRSAERGQGVECPSCTNHKRFKSAKALADHLKAVHRHLL